MNKLEEMMASAKEADATKLFGMSKEKIDTLVRDARWISRYRMARAEHGWSQEHVASKLRVGRQKISRFENGQIKALTPAQVLELAYILKIEPGDHPYIKDAACRKCEQSHQQVVKVEPCYRKCESHPDIIDVTFTDGRVDKYTRIFPLI